MKYCLDETTKCYYFLIPSYIRNYISPDFKKIFGAVPKEHLILLKNNSAYFYFPEGAQEKVGRVIINKIKQDPGWLKKIQSLFNIQRNLLEKQLANHLKAGVSKQYLAKLISGYKGILKYGMIVEPYNRASNEISQFSRGLILPLDFEDLITPNFQGFVARYAKSLDQVRKKKKSIDRHIEDFIWIKSGHFAYSPLTRNDVLKQVKEDKGYQPPKKIDKDLLIKQYKLHSDFKTVIKSLDTIAKIHNDRKEVFIKYSYCMNNFILPKLATRLKIPQSLIRYIDLEKETDQIFDSKKRSEVLKKARARKEICLCRAQIDQCQEYYGQEARKMIKKIASPKARAAKEIVKGMPACSFPGIIQGKVKIIHSSRESKKFRYGDVLVTTMTKPDFVPLMKKAAAIITDEGGLTSHAVIIARELGIPCIIGTGNATHVLKNGDQVKVDCKKGTVGLLKK